MTINKLNKQGDKRKVKVYAMFLDLRTLGKYFYIKSRQLFKHLEVTAFVVVEIYRIFCWVIQKSCERIWQQWLVVVWPERLRCTGWYCKGRYAPRPMVCSSFRQARRVISRSDYHPLLIFIRHN
jgi:hypothetical protein